MPHEDPANWQPIREMPLIGRTIDGALATTPNNAVAQPG